MYLKDLTFEQWVKNHPPDHNDKWYRELYPFNVFSKIDFCETQIRQEQKINFSGVSYFVTITKVELQDNERHRTTFDIATYPKSKRQEWLNRKWNSTFQIVYTQDFQFVTVFAKKEDPSKDFVYRFMKGSFQKISENKSIPVSELLIRTLILHISEEGFPGGKHNKVYEFKREGIIYIPEHPQLPRKKTNYFAPIFSIDRDLWICYSFNEEKAHRIAFYNANQCHKLIVVFCNPTYSRHQRCTYANTSVISMYEFSNLVSPEIRRKYEGQIQFLQNHLNRSPKLIIKELLTEIEYPSKEIYNINKSDLMEAFAIMKIHPSTDDDFFHFLCAVNLINAFLSRQRAKKELKKKEYKLFKNMYYFKTYLSNILTERIKANNFSCPIFITENLIMIEVKEFQFSFHNVPLNDALLQYIQSPLNKEIFWNGKRLQPIAPLLLNYSRACRQKV